jgi:hypothetical protein
MEVTLRSACPYIESATEVSGHIALGGEAGRYKRPKPINNGLGCPDTIYHVFAFHDGRPVVLAFDYWPLRFNELGTDNAWVLAQEIIDSFRFVD